MRVWLTVLLMVLIQGCGGSNDTASVDVPKPPAVVIPSPALLSNAMASCGIWSQHLPDFKPPYYLQRQQRWVVMGSSSAFGAGASSYANSWAGQLKDLAATYGAEVVNIARGGYTTYHALSSACSINNMRPQPDLAHNIDLAIELGADLVILSFPSNDAASNFPAEETAFNLLYMRTRLADKSIPLILLGAQPRNMSAAKQRLLIELDSLLKPRFSPCLVELYSHLVDNAGNLAAQYDSGDGVHFNDSGHAVVFSKLKALITDRSNNSCFSG
ncbi:SGNH/GDSL hydrolase family protein [Rheinheimera sp. UJ51]|uniref:SGNH/GDSL hydrolase family protein n=1 Tax=Rheinheimera sp. UJ51 TaxID=2892446 RepID=UPI001E651B8F|nr:SGNH/GDSL hydrolase family protein [Rheinheimera sp. UJ51]MCC5450271.1 SGNH/GDSL hydrolase family protein [Rheinheimera sp. UJ51]